MISIWQPESPASSTVSEAELIAAAEPDTACWFDDGNLVIVAGGSKFLAYGGHLVCLSPVFKNMFSFPQSPSPERPAVVLRDEPAVIRRFLAAILYTQSVGATLCDVSLRRLIHYQNVSLPYPGLRLRDRFGSYSRRTQVPD